MRKSILVLATATLASTFLLAGSVSAQVAPSTKFQQLLEKDQIATVYVARGGRGGAVRRPVGVRGGAYRGAYRGGYRGNVARAGVYRGNVVRAGAYRGPYARRYYGGRYYRPYANYGRPYYRRAYYGGYYRPYYGGSYPYSYGYNYPYGYGAAAVTGALVGSAIASQPVVTGSIGSGVSYCAQRYRTYNPATGTFTGRDGRQHRCP